MAEKVLISFAKKLGQTQKKIDEIKFKRQGFLSPTVGQNTPSSIYGNNAEGVFGGIPGLTNPSWEEWGRQFSTEESKPDFTLPDFFDPDYEQKMLDVQKRYQAQRVTERASENPPFNAFLYAYLRDFNAPEALLKANSGKRGFLTPSEEGQVKREEAEWYDKASQYYDQIYGAGEAQKAKFRRAPVAALELFSLPMMGVGSGAARVLENIVEPSKGWETTTPAEAAFGLMDVGIAGQFAKPVIGAAGRFVEKNVPKAIESLKPLVREIAAGEAGAIGKVPSEPLSFRGRETFSGIELENLDKAISELPTGAKELVKDIPIRRLPKSEIESMPSELKAGLRFAKAVTWNKLRINIPEGTILDMPTIAHEIVHMKYGKLPPEFIKEADDLAIDIGKRIVTEARKRVPVNTPEFFRNQGARKEFNLLIYAKDKQFAHELSMVVPSYQYADIAKSLGIDITDKQYLNLAVNKYLAERYKLPIMRGEEAEEFTAYLASANEDFRNRLFQKFEIKLPVSIKAQQASKPLEGQTPLIKTQPQVIKIGDTVKDTQGRIWKVLDNSDPSLLYVQNESGAKTMIGKTKVELVPETVKPTVKENVTVQPKELTLYHGTKAEFADADIATGKKMYGIHLTTDEGAAKLYGKVKKYTISNDVKTLDLSDGETLWDFMGKNGILDAEDMANVDLERYIKDGQLFQYDISSHTYLADDVAKTAESLGYDLVKMPDDLGGRGDNIAYVVVNKKILKPPAEVAKGEARVPGVQGVTGETTPLVKQNVVTPPAEAVKPPVEPPKAEVPPPQPPKQPPPPKRVPFYERNIPEQPERPPVATPMTPRQPPPEPPTTTGFPSGREPGGISRQKPSVPVDNLKLAEQALTPDEIPLKQTLKNLKDDVMRKFYQDIRVFKTLPGDSWDLAKQVRGATANGESIIRNEILPVLKPVAKDLKNLNTYMSLQRDLDIIAKNPSAKLPGDITSGGGVYQALDQLKTKIGAKRFGQLEETATKLYALNDKWKLQALEDAGLIDGKTHTAILADNRHYTPFYRTDFTGDVVRDLKASSEASVSSTGIKRMTEGGSIRKLDDPLANNLAQYIQVQETIARNKAAESVVTALQKADPETVKLVEPLGKVKKAANVSGEVIPEAVKGEHSQIIDTISFYKNGTKYTYEVPKIFAVAAKSLDAEASNVFNKVMSIMNAPLRYGAVTYNPAFLPVNVLRDLSTAFFREKLIPLSPSHIQGLWAAITKNATFTEYARGNALMSGIVDSMRSTEAIKRVSMAGGIPLRNAKDVALALPRLIEKANLIGEQSTRIATGIKLKKMGIPELERMTRVRDVTVDFAQTGTWMKTVNNIIPFSNASLQGTVNVLRTIKDHPKWIPIAASPFIVASVLARTNNMRYESSKDIPYYEYTNYWVVQFGEYTKNDGTKGPLYFKIPKGQIGSTLTFPAEAIFSWTQNSNNRGILDILGESLSSTLETVSPVPTNVTGVLPPLVGTAVELAANKNLYTGMPVIPTKEQNLLPEQQFGAETDKIAVALGQKFNVSPRYIDFALKDYTGGTGQTASWLSSHILGALGYNPEVYGQGVQGEPTTQENISGVPVVSRFVGTKATQLQREGYDRFNQTSDDTNRRFNAVPGINALGVRLGDAGDSINNVTLTPQQRAEYQQVIADTVIPQMPSILVKANTIPKDQRRDWVVKQITALKAVARNKYESTLNKQVPAKITTPSPTTPARTPAPTTKRRVLSPTVR